MGRAHGPFWRESGGIGRALPQYTADLGPLLSRCTHSAPRNPRPKGSGRTVSGYSRNYIHVSSDESERHGRAPTQYAVSASRRQSTRLGQGRTAIVLAGSVRTILYCRRTRERRANRHGGRYLRRSTCVMAHLGGVKRGGRGVSHQYGGAAASTPGWTTL